MRVPDADVAASASSDVVDGGLGDADVARAHSAALVAGIKDVAVGKFGVRPIPEEALPAIVDALAALEAWEAAAEGALDAPFEEEAAGGAGDAAENARMELRLQRASLLGALFVKAEISPAEMRILQICLGGVGVAKGLVREVDGRRISAGDVLAYVSAPMPRRVVVDGQGSFDAVDANLHEGGLVLLYELALALLSGESLSRERAEYLGRLLYDHRNNTCRAVQVKALIAHVMRIRHESADELIGLAFAASASASVERPKGFVSKQPLLRPLFAHLAEPFDGSFTWDLLTPLIARYLRERHGFNVVLATGVSSGPKFGPNLRDVALELGIPFAKDAAEVTSLASTAEFGVAVDQADISPGLAAWVRIRRAIVKRPALATVEKYVDVVPGQASLFIGSAFHTSYVDKMASTAEALGYASYIIVSKGVEGSIGVGGDGRRSASFLVGVRSVEGAYVRTELDAPRVNVRNQDDNDPEATGIPEKGSATARRASTLTQAFVRDGTSGNACFDARVAATFEALDSAMEIINNKPTLAI